MVSTSFFVDKFRVAHSRTTSTRHPASSSSLICLASRSMLRASFSFQNSVLDFGTRKFWHPSWACQKHPCMNIADLYFGRTMSGEPGKFFAWRRYLNPKACRPWRTTISGFVFREPIRDIISDLFIVSFSAKQFSPRSYGDGIGDPRTHRLGNCSRYRRGNRVPELTIRLRIRDSNFPRSVRSGPIESHQARALAWREPPRVLAVLGDQDLRAVLVGAGAQRAGNAGRSTQAEA